MGFVSVARAVYDYTAQGSDELSIIEGDLLLVQEQDQGDGWIKAKKKATEDDEDEPEGLAPANYIENAHPLSHAKCLYDYDRQTEEEVSFAEHDTVQVYDTSDPDWTLVKGRDEFGFAPSNYIDIVDEDADDEGPPPPPKPARPQEHIPTEEQDDDVPRNPAAALAGVLQQRTGPTATITTARQPQYTPEASDEDAANPPLPQRPNERSLSPPPTQYASPSPRSPEPPGVHASSGRSRTQSMRYDAPVSPSGYHMYNIHEMISHMGKNKKMPTTLGINAGTGRILIAPEKSRDGPQQEWTADRMTHYSIEGKHVFIELVRPSKSIDFHAGAKDTAQEITAALGELAGAARAEGLKEVLAAGTGKGGQKKGQMLYDFMAQGDDEVTVAENDEVIVLDDTKSDEWWMVRRLKNNKEGVVPRQYVEITGAIEAPVDAGFAQARSTVQQNRLDEERLTREALETSEREKRNNRRQSQPDRKDVDPNSRPKPTAANVRTWTDRSATFHVDAEFLGLKDGKIHLHKLNGVKIAVAANRMSVTDLEYVERMTGQSLDDEKPLSTAIDKRRASERRSSKRPSLRPQNGAAFQSSDTAKYDWFDFFLQCGVNPQICERYALAFDRDQLSEESLPDIQPTLLRTLGLKEGDILRVMKHLDEKYGRKRSLEGETADNAGADGNGLFSGPGGALRNNTRKGRPAPALTNNDTVDPRAFEQNAIRKDAADEVSPVPPRTTSAAAATSLSSNAHRPKTSGFDDDAWNVKPSKPLPPTPPDGLKSPSPGTQMVAPAPQKPTPTGAMAELSLLSPPLQPQQSGPSPATPPTNQNNAASLVPQQQHQPANTPIQSQPTAANRAFFDQLGAPQMQGQILNQADQISVARQRPLPPQQTGQTQSSFLPQPPVNRSASAPQNQHPSAFAPPPLQPQMTGYQGQPAMPGQSLSDLTQQRFQQQFIQQPSISGFQPQQTGFAIANQPQSQFVQQPMQPQAANFLSQQPQQYPPPQAHQPQLNGQQTGSPFADPPRAPFQPQPTGFQSSFLQQQPLQPQATGVNSMLPAPLQPQPTGAGFGGFGPQPNGFAQSQAAPPMPPVPSLSQQQSAPALLPQKTGPAPPVQFGVNSANKIMPQATGKANLANATATNPFGF
ncbi:MAG: hypothetical protein Q9159_001836 [Coniocarpon cinnabarinum]